jgi:hypothetical protein
MRINDVNLLKQVVHYLDNHKEAVRIKKMLYCLCTNRWEKDVDYLNSIASQNLVEQIINDYNTLDQLKFLLQRLVKTVNKPQQYIEIAKTIYLAIGQLYPEFHQEHRSKSKSPSPAPSASQPEPSAVPSAIYRAYAPEPTYADVREVPEAVARAYAPVESPAYDSYAPSPQYNQYGEEIAPANGGNNGEYEYETYYDAEAPMDMPFEDIPVPEYDSFVLRQNVMGYTNPLRAKILLLLMLYPHFNFNAQSMNSLREYNLDDLLFEVMKSYPTIEYLEEAINMAVEQLIEVEEYGKTATGLLQSLIPLYVAREQGQAVAA